MRRFPLASIALALTVAGSGGSRLAAQTVTADVVYGHKDGMALTYDVVRPTRSANGAGVVYMVSGGWVSRWSDPARTVAASPFSDLLRRGFTLFLVRHGSSPRFKVPDAAADARLAVAHIRSVADSFGVSPDRLGVMGSSAGGHLSLMVGLRAEGVEGRTEVAEGRAEDAVGRAEVGAVGAEAPARPNQVGAIVAFFPPIDLRGWTGPSDRFPALDFAADEAASVSPILFVTPDDPPTLLLHGDEDRLVPLEHSQRLHAALQEAGVVSDFAFFPGAGHGFRGDDARRSVQLLVEWFERHLLEGAGR